MKINLTHCAVSFIFGACLSRILPYLPITILLLALISSVLYKRFLKGSIVIAFLFALLGFLYSLPHEDIDIEALLNKKIVLTFHTDSYNQDKILYRNVKIHELYEYESKRKININKVNVFSKVNLQAFVLYKAVGIVSNDSFYLNPNSYQDNLVINLNEIYIIGDYSPSFVDKMRSKVNDYFNSNFSKEVSAFLKSIVTGDRDDLGKDLKNAFSKTGLSHILSISGAHFGLLMFIVFKLISLIISLLPERFLVKMTLHIRPSQVSAILTAPVVIFYLTLSSMNYPAIRAFIMITLFLLSLLIDRRRYMAQSITLAGFIIILIFPDSFTDLSFQLSFLSVLSIYLGMTLCECLMNETKKEISLKEKILKPVRDLLVVTISATIGTGVLTAYYFNYFSIISPLSNLFVTPFIGFVILPLAILSALFNLLTDGVIFTTLLSGATEIMLMTVKYLSGFTYSDMAVASFPRIFLFLSIISILIASVITASKFNMLTKKDSLIILLLVTFPIILIISFKLFHKIDGELIVTFVDVGQGDSIVVELPDRKIIVIDTGKNSLITSRFLRYRGIRQIDALVISHPQRDHVGGISRLVSDFKIKEIWDNGFVSYAEGLISGIYHRSLQRGDKTAGIGYNILVVHPYRDYKPDKNIENNLSLVIKIETIKNSYLFTGDIEIEAIDDITHLRDRLKSTVLKFPHHGSKTSVSTQFLELVSPKIVIISVGRNNPYNLPHKETLSALDSVMLYRTDLMGAIRIKENKKGELSVMTARDFRFKKTVLFAEELSNLKNLFNVWH
ncbi:MAG TPA: DNA internalization-related competence protein ComEC/Rec2 [Nitrospirae bacterium]|nr:DNA internalization-related competence protein ComEC/Rec2 [Nitrospirota bacterium]